MDLKSFFISDSIPKLSNNGDFNLYNSNPKLKSQGCPATIDPSILNEQVMPGKGERPPSNPGMQKHPVVWICIAAGFLLWGGPEHDDGEGGDDEIWPPEQ